MLLTDVWARGRLSQAIAARHADQPLLRRSTFEPRIYTLAQK
jgi:hypothetical protein